MMRFFLTSLSLLFFFVLSSAAEVDASLFQLEQKVVQVVDRVKNSVVALRSDQGSSGSGVIVNAEGLIYTAAHVVEGSEEMTAVFADGSEHRVEILGLNRFKDAALARLVEKKEWPYAPVGDSDNLEVTDWVIALGHGRGYDPTRPAPVRFGRVRAHNPGRFITTDCILIGGDSGGPLYNLKGEVVAIHSSINGLARFNVHAGVSGFQDDLARMKRGERWGYLIPNVLYNAETPILGVEWDPRAGARPEISRPFIGSVIEGGPADRALLQPGDLVREINGEEVTTQFDVAVSLGRQKTGQKIPVIFERGKKLFSAEVQLIARGEVIKDDRVINMARLTERDDSPYVRKPDLKRLDAQAAGLFTKAQELANLRSDTYVGLYRLDDLTNPIINATVIGDEKVLAPLSAVLPVSDELVAWRPGLSGLPVELIGGYEEHDLAVLKVPGLRATSSLLDEIEEVQLGHFIYALALYENKQKTQRETGLLSKGVVSVLARELPAFFGVGAARASEKDGAMVGRVVQDTAAAQLGLQPRDIITRFNGAKIRDFEGLREEISRLKVGSKVRVTYLREGRAKEAEIVLKNGRGNDSMRINAMDQMGRNTLSQNRSNFQKVLQSDMIIAPEQCGAPVYGLRGNFVGIVISDAGRNKSYIIPAEVIAETLQEEPRPVDYSQSVSFRSDASDLDSQPGLWQERRLDSPIENEDLSRRIREQMRSFEGTQDLQDLMEEVFKSFFGR